MPWAADASWQALFGGRTNAAWLVEDTGQAAVLKLYRQGTENPLFPNDPAAEARMLSHLEGHALAPQLIAHFECDGVACNLYHALRGKPWRSGVTEVADLIKTLHQIPPPIGVRRIPNGAREIRQHAEQILALADKTLPQPESVALATTAPTTTDVLLHCDVVPGNLIRCENGLRLIDWQCPAVGDATEDIAVFMSPAMQLLYRGEVLSATEESHFLAAFPQEQRDRYAALAPVYHYRMAAYCLWQVSRGHADYQEAFEAECAALYRDDRSRLRIAKEA